MKKDKIAILQEGFSLLEIIIVIAIIGLLAATTILSFKPQELFADGRNTKRIGDIVTLNKAISHWLTREGTTYADPFEALGLLDEGVTSITPSDGSIADEGIEATSLNLISPTYVHIIPKDPDNITEYRVGVDDIANPQHIFICTDEIEDTTNHPYTSYPNGIFCQST